MKKFFALVALLGCLLSLCCAPSSKPPAPPPPPTKVAPATRHVEITIHADTSFNGPGRVLIFLAAERWRRLTRERAEIDITFDVTDENVEERLAVGDNLLIGVRSTSEVGKEIDAILDGGNPLARPLAATIVSPNRGPIAVFLIVDRIAASKFLAVVTHEFGHVLGLPDLDLEGSIMSGTARSDAEPVESFTPADVMLCRAAHLCD